MEPAEPTHDSLRPEGQTRPLLRAAGQAPHPDDLPLPADLRGHPRYLVLERVGSGAMGTVYKAVHLLMERVVALKVVRPELLSRPGADQRFRREARAAARLHHPNIVHAYDAESAGDAHFLVMEFVEGANLADRLRGGPLPAAEACRYAREAALGLQHAHEQGMVHRDVKPHNLMLTPAGQVKILDFGLARFVSEAAAGGAQPAAWLLGSAGLGSTAAEGGPAPAQAAGTPDYVAPEEVADPAAADIRADVYSLGCTLYRLLAGRVPFPGGGALEKVRRHQREDPEPLDRLRPGLPGGLAAAVGRMMAKDPARRFQTPAEAAAALAPFTATTVRRALVVDDDPAAREALAAALAREGWAVSTAADGQEALARLREGPVPALVLLDLVMPGMDGWEFLRQREKDPALKAVPVVVVSAAAAQAWGEGLGVAAHLRKPVEPDQLAREVRRRAGGAG
jgi:CheY-like chemotaxis protein